MQVLTSTGWPGRVFTFALLLVASACQRPFHGEPVNPPQRAMNFQARLGDGQTFELKSMAGEVVLLGFGYTSCPDVCPLTLGRLASLYRALGDDAAHVRAVFVTVDPDRDTPERLQAYAASFDPRITGVSLSPPLLQRILPAYGVTAQRREVKGTVLSGGAAGSGGYYALDHTSGFLLIDRRGLIRVRTPHDLPIDKLAQDVRKLLAEPDGPSDTEVPRIREPTARIGPTGIGAAYFTVVNPSATADRLVRVESASASRVELHEVRHEDGVARMIAHPDGFELPARGTLSLTAGGRHVMLFDVPTDSQDPIPLTLHFSRADPIQVRAVRLSPSALATH